MGKAGTGKRSKSTASDAPKPSVADLARAAVIKALLNGGDLKLVDKSDGLFASNAAGNKTVIERCLADPPLLVKSPSDKSKGQTPKLVHAAPNSIELIWDHCNEEERQALLPIRTAVLKKRSDDLQKRLVDSRHALARWQTELVNVHADFVKVYDDFNQHMNMIVEEHKAAVSTLKDLEGKAAALAKIETPEIRVEPAPTPDVPAVSKTALAPQTPDDEVYRRQLAQALVSAWREAPDENSKRYLAQAMHNSGMERIGNTGERTKYVSQFHLPSGPMFPGDSVKIVEPGWKMRDDRGEYILAPARVEQFD